MLTAFADWIEKGYRGLTERSGKPGRLVSYRFWAGGPRGGSLLCGVVKDSSDSVGRPYPLILMGMGPLTDWEAHWHQVPMACEAPWGQLESMSTRAYRDFRQMESDLRAIKPPVPDWEAYSTESEINRDATEDELGVAEIQAALADQGSPEVLFIRVAEDRFGDSTGNLRHLHMLLRSSGSTLPKAVFMGGMPSATLLAVFKRPLLAEDFGKLWFVGPAS
jgi:type VI secretion system protein VasJ